MVAKRIIPRVSECNNADTPRQKLLTRGAAAMSNAELLSLFVNLGSVDKARDALAQYGSLRSLLSQPTPVLRKVFGPINAARLLAATEIHERNMAEGLERGEAVSDPRAAGKYIAARLRAFPYEVFAAMFLDSHHRLLGFEELFRGTIDGAEVHPREVVRRALAHNAAAVIIGHNHPSGSAEPSAADRAVTARLKQALALVDIRLLDHFVIGDGPAVSLAARGWL